MLTQEHKASIIKKLKIDGEDLYLTSPRVVEEIVDVVNAELDSEYVAYEDADERLKCRRFLHHREGIEAISKDLTNRFGELYGALIRKIATWHVLDDMGKIYSKKDYEDENFWPKWKAKNETVCSWV